MRNLYLHLSWITRHEDRSVGTNERFGLLITLLTAALFLLTQGLNAQNVGINESGNSPNTSAILDVSADVNADKGVLIPRLTLDDPATTAPVSSPADGLLIYNQSGTEPEGFYYWEAGVSQWIQLFDSSTPDDDWSDAGTGTMYATSTSDNVGIGLTNPSEKLDVSGNVEFTGALQPGGNAGSSGDVLTSQGAGNPPVWQAQSGGSTSGEVNAISNAEWTGVDWATCADNCATLTENGNSDWRMPNWEEARFYRTRFQPPDGSWLGGTWTRTVWDATLDGTASDYGTWVYLNESNGVWTREDYNDPIDCRCVR